MEQQEKDLQKDMHEVKLKVSEMYYALMGNPLSKDGGLIGRIDRIEKRLENNDDRMDKQEKRIDKQDEKQSIITVYQKVAYIIGGAIGSAILNYIFNHL